MKMFRQDCETLAVTVDGKVEDLNLALDEVLSSEYADYIWYWQAKPRFKLNVKGNASCLLRCEDCVGDLWMGTCVMRDLSLRFPDLEMRLRTVEQDTNFILIELADLLQDDWINDYDEFNSQVLIVNGKLRLQIKQKDTGLHRIHEFDSSVNEYFEKKLHSLDRSSNAVNFDCDLPARLAASISIKPWMLTEIIHRYLDAVNIVNVPPNTSSAQTVSFRIGISRTLFAKLYFRCHSWESVSPALIAGYQMLISKNASKNRADKPDYQMSGLQRAGEGSNDLASESQTAKFLAQYTEPKPRLEEPDLGWLYQFDEELKRVQSRFCTTELADVDTAINDFFAERGCVRGARLPWNIGPGQDKPLSFDGDAILRALEGLNAEEHDSSDDTTSSDESEYTRYPEQGLPYMDDLMKSAAEGDGPVDTLLSSFGINIEENRDLKSN